MCAATIRTKTIRPSVSNANPVTTALTVKQTIFNVLTDLGLLVHKSSARSALLDSNALIQTSPSPTPACWEPMR